MSILNVNQLQPVGGGNTITVSASDISASGATITASSFVGNITGNVTSSSTSEFSSGLNVTGGHIDLVDNSKIRVGTGDDLQIYHNGTDSYISDTATGSLILTGSRVIVKNTADNARMIDAIEGGAVKLLHNNSEKLETTSNGIQISGDQVLNGHLDMRDSDRIRLGAGDDLSIFHNGTHNFIDSAGSADLYVRGANILLQDHVNSNRNWLIGLANGTLEMYHAGAKKLETTTSGISVAGDTVLTTANAAFKSENPNSSGDYVRMYAGAGTAQWDIYGNGELLRMSENSGNSAARVQFDLPTTHRSTSTTTGVAALTAQQEVNNGGYLIFDGKNSSGTSVFNVTHNGRVRVSDGIDFSSNSNTSGMTSELLDDYEEGTWTPNFTNVSYTPTVQFGRYTKIGRYVYCTITIDGNSLSGSGTIGLEGLPFASDEHSDNGQRSAWHPANGGHMVGLSINDARFRINGSTMQGVKGATGNTTYMTGSQLTSGTFQFTGDFSYYTAS